jgi:hypothetical protein
MTGREAPRDLLYVHTDIPAGMTIREWRAERAGRVATVHAAQRRARRARTPATFMKVLRRLPGELRLRAVALVLPGHPLEGGYR